jgi:predicted GIY-YIG superfamily endonuclease
MMILLILVVLLIYKERILRHKKGYISYTKSRLPIKLITCIAFSDKHKAYKFEKYLKSGSGKAFANKRFK